MADEKITTEEETENQKKEPKKANPKLNFASLRQLIQKKFKVIKVFNLNLYILIAIIVMQPLVGLGIMRYVVLKNSILTPEKITSLLQTTVLDSLNNYHEKIAKLEIEKEETLKEEKKKEKKEKHSLGTMYELDGEIIINPKDTYAIRFMVVAIALELTDKMKGDDLKTWEPIIKDNIIECMMNKRMDYYTNPSNIVLLRAEVKELIEEILGEGTIENVYFPKFVLQ
ncbi:MAG: flagellar basal body-associated FliL family protein [Candidatus Cloacimonadota bacterium]|nr:flagellar basal body-associated FliL family protein [Candidatus Cloacimonadota bacterium]